MRLPDYICDSTRNIPEKEMYGVPILEFELLKQMKPTDTIIVITAGLLDLQAQVVPNELYYFPMFHCRAFEAQYFVRQNQEECRAVRSMLADDKSRRIYDTVLNNYSEGCFWCQSIFENNPYFENDLIEGLSSRDSVAFAGAFNGKHIDRMLSNNPNVKVHAFEPNRKWYDYLCHKFSDRHNVNIHDAVLWNVNDQLRFDGDVANAGLDAHVVTCDEECGDEVVKSVALDTIAEEEDVTLIALDVEGSEGRALRGAEKIISGSRPNLAVCLYHKLSDFVEIPQLIEKLSGGAYRYHVKQHSCISAIETVLYAIRKDY